MIIKLLFNNKLKNLWKFSTKCSNILMYFNDENWLTLMIHNEFYYSIKIEELIASTTSIQISYQKFTSALKYLATLCKDIKCDIYLYIQLCENDVLKLKLFSNFENKEQLIVSIDIDCEWNTIDDVKDLTINNIRNIFIIKHDEENNKRVVRNFFNTLSFLNNLLKSNDDDDDDDDDEKHVYTDLEYIFYKPSKFLAPTMWSVEKKIDKYYYQFSHEQIKRLLLLKNYKDIIDMSILLVDDKKIVFKFVFKYGGYFIIL